MEELTALVLRAREGDPEAYGDLVRRFQNMAVGYAYSILGDFHLAEDAAQEAFVGAYLDLSSLREPVAFPGWFRRLVFTRCGRFTWGKKMETVPIEKTPVPALEKQPDELAEEHQTRDRLASAMEALPAPEREALTLFYIDEFSYKEIAGFLDVPLSTIKYRLHAARKRLKKEMLAMARRKLATQRPSRDGGFVAKTLEVLKGLNDYQMGKLLVNTEQRELILLMRSSTDLRREILSHLSPPVRTFLEKKMKRENATSEDPEQVHKRVVEKAARIPADPPDLDDEFVEMKEGLKRDLTARTMVEMGPDTIAAHFGRLAEVARTEGVAGLETFLQARDPFFTAGLQLLLHGTEPDLIAEVQQPWQETLIHHKKTRLDMISTALSEIACNRYPMLVAHRLSTLFQPDLRGISVEEQDGTIDHLEKLLTRMPFAQMDLDQLAECLMVMVWSAYKGKIEQLSRFIDMIDDDFTGTVLRWLTEGIEGIRPDRAILLDMLEPRKQALLRNSDLCYSMVNDGLVSLQRGMNPRLLESRLLNYCS